MVILLLGWNRASHHSQALGAQQVSDGLGVCPWSPWSSCNYGTGEWGVFWGLRIFFFPVPSFVSLLFLELSCSLLLLLVYHQSEMKLICLCFVNYLQSYDCNNSDHNLKDPSQSLLWCITVVSFPD